MRRELPSGVVTLLFTDVEGSTRLLRELGGDRYAEALHEHRRVLRATFGAHGGVEVDTQGDAFLVAFDRASEAVTAAADAQRALAGGPVRVRMGVHTGEPRVTEEGYVGMDVHRGARLASAGHGGQVLLSAATAGLVDVPTRDLGEHRLKDMTAPERIHQLEIDGARGEFPALTTLDALPNNLPSFVTPLVGRADDLQAVCGVLASHRLVTLTGAGGAGKTRLALQVAAERLETFPDGVWLVDLAPLTDAALVPRVVASAARVPDEPGLSWEDTLARALRTARALLVIDNCEHVIAAVASLVDHVLRSCADVSVLATSREALNVGGELAWRVPSLGVPEQETVEAVESSAAGSLFLERALAVRPDYELGPTDVPAVADICRRLDGLPLALELAAARMRSLSVAELATHLNDRFRILTGGARVALPRQRTLEATVAWSYGMLTETDQTVFDRLSVFAGGFPLAGAEAVAGHDLDPVRVLDAIDDLVDKSLLDVEETAGESRYRLLETMRSYGRTRLDERGETADTRDRHLAWAASYAHETGMQLYGREQLQSFARVEAALDNFRAGMRWAIENDGVPAGALIGASLYLYWLTRNVREGRGWLDRLLDAGPYLPPLEAAALGARSALELLLGDVDAARDSAGRALELTESLDDPRSRAVAESGYARATWGTAPPAELRERLERALELGRAIEDHVVVGLNLLFLSVWEYEHGSLDAARARSEELLGVAEDIGGEHLLAHALECAGVVDVLDDREEGGARIADAIELYRAMQNRNCINHCLTSAALALSRRDDHATAATLLAACAEFRREFGIVVPPYEDVHTARVDEAVVRGMDADRLEAARRRGAAFDTGAALDLAADTLALSSGS
jgi:predicted ATPase/class 3 adenylate cyclase